ncbi:MAG: amidohydrolase/deacetylase family metallohydrolase [Gaiella sp.]
MRFDVLIRGGEVMDPGAGYEGRLDVAIERDRIAAVDHDIPPESAFHVVDASGQIVTPGLVDLHTHVFHKVTYWGIDPDPVASRTGVTTWNDAGSAGALTLPGLRDFVARPARVGITAFLNISSIGLVCDDYECANSHYLDVDLFRRLADRNRDLVRGVKVRMGNVPTFEGDVLEPLRRARRAADECELPLMVHIAFGPPAIEEVLPFLKPNDVLTHCFTGHAMKIVDAEGRLLESAKRAWDSGVVMDIGHGTGSFSFETAEAVMAAGRKPDVISTDLHQLSVNGPAFDLPTTLSKFIHLGMSLREAVEAATARPAAVLGLENEVGTLRPGSQADVALFRIHRGDFPLQDISGNVRHADQLLRNTATIVGGRLLERLPPAPGAPWTEEPIWPAVQHPFTEKQRQLRELGRTPDMMAAAAGETA